MQSCSCVSPVWVLILALLSVASLHGVLGRAQLYVTLNPAPRDVACQVQPHRGLEAHTIFGIFCMSGRPVRLATPSLSQRLGAEAALREGGQLSGEMPWDAKLHPRDWRQEC